MAKDDETRRCTPYHNRHVRRDQSLRSWAHNGREIVPLKERLYFRSIDDLE